MHPEPSPGGFPFSSTTSSPVLASSKQPVHGMNVEPNDQVMLPETSRVPSNDSPFPPPIMEFSPIIMIILEELPEISIL